MAGFFKRVTPRASTTGMERRQGRDIFIVVRTRRTARLAEPERIVPVLSLNFRAGHVPENETGKIIPEASVRLLWEWGSAPGLRPPPGYF